MNVVDVLLPRGRDAAKVALVTDDSEHTYGELARRVDQVAAFLIQAGVRRGEAVGLLTENSYFALVGYLGVLRAGATAVPLPTNISSAQLGYVVETTRMKVAFVQAKVLAEAAPQLRTLSRVVVDKPVDAPPGFAPGLCAFEDARAEGTVFPEVDEAEDLAQLMFTSGSTQQPRGVMLTHANVLANTRSILEVLGLCADDRVMLVLPLYYSFGASVIHTHLAVGGTVVMDRRFLFPDKVLRRMQEQRCTGFAGVPSHYQVLLRRSKLGAMSFPDLRWLQQAGGKLAANFVDELRALFPSVKLFLMYGSTEATARIACLPPERLAEKRDCVGLAIPGVTVRLLDAAGAPVKVGEVGEIVVEGANVSRGYFQAPEETAETFRERRLHTGDLARADAEGFLYIVDRAKDFLKVGGSRTSSKVLEESLLAFPDIVEAAVLGIPDDTLGEAVAAFVVPRDPEDVSVVPRLLAFVAERMPGHLVPKVVRTLPALPKNNAGKVMKLALRGLL